MSKNDRPDLDAIDDIDERKEKRKAITSEALFGFVWVIFGILLAIEGRWELVVLIVVILVDRVQIAMNDVLYIQMKYLAKKSLRLLDDVFEMAKGVKK